MSQQPTGRQKAAIVLLHLDKAVAIEVVKSFSQDELLDLAITMSQLEKLFIDSTIVENVLREFTLQTQKNSLVLETGNQLFALLKEAFGEHKAEELMAQLKQKPKIRPFENVQQMDAQVLSNILHSEHPQTIALVLAHLSNEKTADILQTFPEEKRLDIIERLLTLDEASVEVINQISEILASRVTIANDSSTVKQDIGDRIKSIAEVLNYLGDFGEKVALQKLATTSPEIAEQIKDHMFMFSDFKYLSPRSIQQVLSQINTKTIALALKGIADDLRDYILSALSKRLRETVLDEKATLGLVPLGDVQEAQREIVKAARNLSENGKIQLRRSKGGQMQMVE